VEGANAQKCQLTKFEYGQRFTDSVCLSALNPLVKKSINFFSL
jgi:hypothetical protein